MGLREETKEGREGNVSTKMKSSTIIVIKNLREKREGSFQTQ